MMCTWEWMAGILGGKMQLCTTMEVESLIVYDNGGRKTMYVEGIIVYDDGGRKSNYG